MNKRLYDAFASLSQEEIDRFLSAEFEGDTADIDTAQIKRRTLQKAGLLPAGKETAMKKLYTKKHLKTWLVAAVLVGLIAFSAVAAVKLLPPKKMIEDLSLNPNALTATETKIVEQHSNGLVFTLEGVTQGKLPEGYTFNGERPTDDDCTYAIVSIRSEDGKPFWYVDDESGYHANNFGFTILVNGFAPNSSMFKTDYIHDGRYFYEDQKNNVLYWAYDITNALCFADRGVLLQVCDGMCTGPEEIRIDKNGDFYFEESYPGIRVIFDITLDPKLADREKAAAWEKESCFNTYDEMVTLYQADGENYDTVEYVNPDSFTEATELVPTTRAKLKRPAR